MKLLLGFFGIAATTTTAFEVVEGEKPSDCAHSVGYLKTLSKGTPTPEECLTCTSLIDCKY